MSVTFHLYKMRPDIEFKGHWWMDIPQSKMSHDALWDLQAKLGGPGEPSENMSAEECNKLFSLDREWEKKMDCAAFSDNQHHDIIYLDDEKRFFRKYRSGKRMMKRLDKFPSKIFDRKYYKFKYLVCDEIEYRQGWFLSKRFFKKKCTIYYCTTNKEVENFFKMYLNNSRDDRGIEAMHTFLDAWEDGMLFECAW